MEAGPPPLAGAPHTARLRGQSRMTRGQGREPTAHGCRDGAATAALMTVAGPAHPYGPGLLPRARPGRATPPQHEAYQ